MVTTLTLNPAFDVHVDISELIIGRENLARGVSRNIGGKGINISRALLKNGVDNLAIVALGDENGADFERELICAGIKYEAIQCNGHIRENITVHPDDAPETRLSFRGFAVDDTLLDRVAELIDGSDIVTFTGSTPEGICTESIAKFLAKMRESGVRLVVDSKSVTLEMLRKIKPWLIKPNAEECEMYFGKIGERELYRAALLLHAEGIENVMISLGGEGAILASGGKLYLANAPKITPVSTIGAGDSAIAGFIAHEGDAKKRLRLAVAYGSAACLTKGTNPPIKADIERLYKEISVTEINI